MSGRGPRNTPSSAAAEGETSSPPGHSPQRVRRWDCRLMNHPRALFGPTNHEENLRFVRKELEKTKNEAASKW